MTKKVPKIIEILLVEDSKPDIDLTKEALKKSKVYNNLNIVRDGQEALDYLNKKKRYDDKPRPDLILLDLNLPKVDGIEVLNKIKENPELKRIPVVILTTSESDEDIIKSYEGHANCYITKPIDMDQFSKVVSNISNFWFSIVKLPED